MLRYEPLRTDMWLPSDKSVEVGPTTLRVRAYEWSRGVAKAFACSRYCCAIYSRCQSHILWDTYYGRVQYCIRTI